MLSLIAYTFALAGPQPPNIVYVMADDLGYGELGCYGQQKIPTPNIDRIAAEGVRFTRFYSPSPVCAPSRYSLMTGRHQGRATIRGNKEQSPGFGVNDPEGQFPLPKSETTVAEVLKRAGYTTGIVGKWGLGGPKPDENPLAHGFDFFYGYLCQKRSHNFYPPYLWRDYGVDLLVGNRPFNAHQRISEPLASEDDYRQRFAGQDYAPERMIREASRFIAGSKGKPFFLYYAPTLPHVALQAPAEWIDRFPREWDSKPYLGDKGYLPSARPRATYAAMIAYLDHMVGELDKSLDKMGVKGNTLVIFTSDNGATFTGGVDREFFQSNGILRDGKMSLYEGGIRVPFVARWPGRIAPGTTSNHVAVGFDTMATLAQIVGAQAPSNDGLSYLAALTGAHQRERDHVYFEYPEASSQQCVLFGRYKAIRPNLKKTPGKVEIYDLESDPSERQDLSASRPDLVKKGLAILAKEHRPSKDFPLSGVDQ